MQFSKQSDIENRIATGETSEQSLSINADDINALAGKKFNFLDEEETTRNISPVSPIEDFKKMITDRTVDLVEDAIKQMTGIIRRFINDSLKGNFYDKALECLKVLRKGCIDEDECDAFNEFIHDLREKCKEGKHQDFWKMVTFSLQKNSIYKSYIHLLNVI
jgi:ATP-dependent DNA helicase 2 subunit 2